MKYTQLTRTDRAVFLARLESMPDFVEAFVKACPADALTTPGPEGSFSPVEHCWHLADLEREGFAERIRRLLSEDDPQLQDFDGDRQARERGYRSLSAADGLKAFREARARNLDSFRSMAGDAWSRGGTQEGVGRIMLCDLPEMMADHDASHRAECEAWRRAIVGNPVDR